MRGGKESMRRMEISWELWWRWGGEVRLEYRKAMLRDKTPPSSPFVIKPAVTLVVSLY